MAFALALGSLCLSTRAANRAAPRTTCSATEESIYLHADKVLVRPGLEIAHAGVLVQRGRIVAVGPEVTAPEGARVIEGRVICAGFVDPWSAFGLDGEALGEKGASFATRTSDALDPYTFDADLAGSVLRAGVTSVCTQGGRTGRTGGFGAFVRLPLATDLEESLVHEDSCIRMSVSDAESPYDPFNAIDLVDRVVRALEDGDKYGIEQTEYRYELEAWEKAIAEKEAELEKDFKKVKKEREKEVEKAEKEDKEFKDKKYKEDSKPREPRFDADKDVLARVVNGELPLVVEAHRAAELHDLMERTKPFGRVRLIIAGGTEALSVADALVERRVPVLVSPAPQGADALEAFDGVDLALAGRLREAGVRVLLGSGTQKALGSRDLPLLAGLAIGHGLSREDALAALTIDAARAFDVADHLGSVERGKDADLLVLDGDPLVSTTHVSYVLSRGRVVVDPASPQSKAE